MKHFQYILNELINAPNGAKYDLKLPRNDEMPQSMIANMLNNSLKQDANDRLQLNNINDDELLIICETIIIAFRSIYYKYIDAANAMFMINISGRKRNAVYKLLDCRYYLQDQRKHSSSTNTNKNSNKKSIWQDILRLNTFTQHYNYSIVDSNDKSFINDQLQDYIQLLKYNKSLTKKECFNKIFEWLLSRLMTNMEPCVEEISILINDSFGRFKTKQKDTYNKLCHLIETNISTVQSRI